MEKYSSLPYNVVSEGI